LRAGATRIQFEILDRYIILGRQPGAVVSSANLLSIWKTLLHEGGNLLCLAKLPWHVLFPAAEPDRYKLRFQLERLKTLRSKL
jgi:hypothetical protein